MKKLTTQEGQKLKRLRDALENGLTVEIFNGDAEYEKVDYIQDFWLHRYRIKEETE